MTTKELEQRFRKHISRLQDLTLLVLKGHLLLEEQLELFLQLSARAPESLKDARLTYAQKLQLVQALSGMQMREFVFAASINSIRNRLAHRLELDDLEERIFTTVRQYDETVPKNLTRRQLSGCLRAQVAIVCAILHGVAKGFHATTQANKALNATVGRGRPPAR